MDGDVRFTEQVIVKEIEILMTRSQPYENSREEYSRQRKMLTQNFYGWD